MNFNEIIIEKVPQYEKRPFKKTNSVIIEKINKSSKEHKFIFKQQNTLESKNVKISRIKDPKCKWKEVKEIELDIFFNFIPGDSIGMICPNSEEYTKTMMKILGLNNNFYTIERNGKSGFYFEGFIEDFFKYKFDFLSIPKKAFLFELSKTAEKSHELEYLCSKEGVNDYYKLYTNWNNILDVLNTFKCKPSLETILENCEIIKPRYFSLTNKTDEKCKILIGLISKEFKDYKRYGQCSNYFRKAVENEEIEVVYRENKLLRQKNTQKQLLICTGTGIAPFISFVVNKSENMNIWMLYGFRHEEDDLSGDLKNLIKINKFLSSKGKYVTDYLINIDIKNFIEQDCSVYVCGNMNMQQSVLKILESNYSFLFEEQRIFFDNWA